MQRYNVLNYGLKADGEFLNSYKMQRLVDICSDNGGGVIYFPEGKYVLSTVFLKDNVKIEISENTEILGSLDFNDYYPDEKVDYSLYQDASHSFFHCSLFVGENCENIGIYGKGKIDMRSVWDEENVRNMVHRGAKCIALKNCKNVRIDGLNIQNVTDLGVYFAGCENVEVSNLDMRVYIDGISPDNSKNCYIHHCKVESGDDGIVFKSSYTLNKIAECDNIKVENCEIKSRCNALKFGTETNGGFKNIEINDIKIKETRISGIAIESVDGAIIDGVKIKNVDMTNVNAPLFIHIGNRMRGPKGREIGQIKNILIENVNAKGPYEPYDIISWNYDSYKNNDTKQYPWIFGNAEGLKKDEEQTKDSVWQMTSNVCGLKNHNLENITLKNFDLKFSGGVKEYSSTVSEEAKDYPEVYVYGKILSAKGIFFRHIENLKLENVKVSTEREDAREDFVFDDVSFAE